MKATKRKPSRPPAAPALDYKVIELSIVDESSLERTLNEWSSRGWRLDSMQFAMRDSSRRPAMAFVLFTRAGSSRETKETVKRSERGRLPADEQVSTDPWRRLRQLAGVQIDDDEPSDPTSE